VNTAVFELLPPRSNSKKLVSLFGWTSIIDKAAADISFTIRNTVNPASYPAAFNEFHSKYPK